MSAPLPLVGRVLMAPRFTWPLTLLAMTAFAGNSLLCRMALNHTGIDPASVTSIRIVSGALTLWLIMRLRRGNSVPAGNWVSGVALFAYATGFSFAYVSLPAATGALLLFGAVQATMIGVGLLAGEQLTARQCVGMACAFGGLVALTYPGLSAPSPLGSMLMLGAGVAWGLYSLRGRGAADPIGVTTGNFLRAAPMAAALALVAMPRSSPDMAGTAYAVVSGALTSGVGYAVWYSALRGLKATSAATVQLSVPVIAALGGAIFLGEAITMRRLVASVAILGGISVVLVRRR